MVIDYQRLISRYHPRYIVGKPPHKLPCFVVFVFLLSVDCQELACLGMSQVLTD